MAASMGAPLAKLAHHSRLIRAWMGGEPSTVPQRARQPMEGLSMRATHPIRKEMNARTCAPKRRYLVRHRLQIFTWSSIAAVVMFAGPTAAKVASAATVVPACATAANPYECTRGYDAGHQAGATSAQHGCALTIPLAFVAGPPLVLSDYSRGYEAGFKDGFRAICSANTGLDYNRGHLVGYQVGFQQGMYSCQQMGSPPSPPNQQGWSNAYRQGYVAGYTAGLQAGCLP
jgi:hypothetical protein